MIIHWNNLHLTPFSIISGFIAFIFGLIAADTVKFLLSIPVFWKGEAKELSGLFYVLSEPNLPWEGMSNFLRIAFNVVIPTLTSVTVTSSIILNKSPVTPLLIMAIAVGTICIFVKSFAWKLALRNYTSASS
jgi:ABC-type uncharacterized transport system permease subunit